MDVGFSSLVLLIVSSCGWILVGGQTCSLSGQTIRRGNFGHALPCRFHSACMLWQQLSAVDCILCTVGCALIWCHDPESLVDSGEGSYSTIYGLLYQNLPRRPITALEWVYSNLAMQQLVLMHAITFQLLEYLDDMHCTACSHAGKPSKLSLIQSPVTQSHHEWSLHVSTVLPDTLHVHGVVQNNILPIQDQVLLTEIKYRGLGYLTLISFSRSLHRLAPITLLMLAKLFVQKHVILQFRCTDNRYIDYSC